MKNLNPTLILSKIILTLSLIILISIAFIIILGKGEYEINYSSIFNVLMKKNKDPIFQQIIYDLRLPTAILAIICGGALGVAGAVTQRITKNSLATPDVLGITQGSAVVVVTCLALGINSIGNNQSMQLYWRFISGLSGGLLAILLLLFFSKGIQVNSVKFILIGIGLALMFQAIILFILISADIVSSTTAYIWLTGSFELAEKTSIIPEIILVSIFLLLIACNSRPLAIALFDDDIIKNLGVNLTKNRAILLFSAIGLTTCTVASTGPIGLVAFLAPQLAKIVSRQPYPPLFFSFLCGAGFLSFSAGLARSFSPHLVPVGIITTAIGGFVFIITAIKMQRRVYT